MSFTITILIACLCFIGIILVYGLYSCAKNIEGLLRITIMLNKQMGDVQEALEKNGIKK